MKITHVKSRVISSTEMFVSRSIDANHKDLIHDVAYDFYGLRMATCSSDQIVKVWDKGDDGQWTCTSSWKAHSGSVWKVSWAHPEFGQVIATCSFDRTAIVWEEIVGDGSAAARGQSQWVKRTTLVDSRTSITDVRFGPRHLGLQLATCSIDGIVRVYDAPDVMNLSQWPLQYEFACKVTCSCIAWNHSRIHPPMIAVGSDDNSPNSGGKVLLFEFGETSRQWQRVEIIASFTEPVHDLAFAPNLGRSYHLLAVACQDVSIVSLKPTQRDSSQGMSRFEMRQVGQFCDHNSVVYRVSWNITGTILASSGDDGCVRLWKANYLDIWKCIAVIKGKTVNMQQAITPGGQSSSSSGRH